MATWKRARGGVFLFTDRSLPSDRAIPPTAPLASPETSFDSLGHDLNDTNPSLNNTRDLSFNDSDTGYTQEFTSNTCYTREQISKGCNARDPTSEFTLHDISLTSDGQDMMSETSGPPSQLTSTPTKTHSEPRFTKSHSGGCCHASLTSPRSATSHVSPLAQHVHCPLLPSQISCGNTSVLSTGSVFCRICHEGERHEELVSPCLCAGTVGKVHISCAERWLSVVNSTKCEICGTHYETQRQPRPFIDWLRTPAQPSDKRNLVGDTMCFLLLTPLAIISDWLCISGAIHYRDTDSARWEVVGLIVLAVFLALIYFTWCAVALRYHVKVYRAWQQHNQVVKIVSDRPAICTADHCRPADHTPMSQPNHHPHFTHSAPLFTSPVSAHSLSPQSVIINPYCTPGGTTYAQSLQVGAAPATGPSLTTARLVRETLV